VQNPFATLLISVGRFVLLSVLFLVFLENTDFSWSNNNTSHFIKTFTAAKKWFIFPKLFCDLIFFPVNLRRQFDDDRHAMKIASVTISHSRLLILFSLFYDVCRDFDLATYCSAV
jgi:hypothetical protein